MADRASIYDELLRRVVCPRCRQSLEPMRNSAVLVSLRCTGCDSRYPIVDGIPILIAGAAERATPPSTDPAELKSLTAHAGEKTD